MKFLLTLIMCSGVSGVGCMPPYEADKKFISHVSLFDAFTSEQMGEGVKSLAIEVTLQPQDANLTEAQIEEISAQIIAKVEKATGGKLRQ